MTDDRVLAEFIEDVVAHPEDVGVRLILADYLSEYGQNGELRWADLIRVQGELRFLCRRGGPPGFMDGTAMTAWEYGAVPTNLLGDNDYGFTLRHGFVEMITCTMSAWFKHGRDVARSHPVRAVNTPDRRPLQLARDAHRWYPCDWDGGGVRELHWVPFQIFRHLDESKHRDHHHASIDDARAALSRACILWGKDKGGKS